MAPWMLVVLLIGWIGSASAGTIQYMTSTGHVTGLSDAEIPTVANRSLVSIAESVTAIQWPVPSGCAAGEGQWEFTRVVDPETVAVDGTGMEVRPDLALFGTTSTLMPGCFNAGDRVRLINLVTIRLMQVVAEQELILALNAFNVVASRRCPGSTGGANCDTVRSNMLALDTSYPNASQLSSVTTELVTLRTETAAFIAAQCSADPGGPFCVP